MNELIKCWDLRRVCTHTPVCTYLCIKIYVLGPQFQRTRVRGSQGGQVQRVAMDLITLQCVCCNASQPQATFGNADPFIHACCEPLDALLIRCLPVMSLFQTSDCCGRLLVIVRCVRRRGRNNFCSKSRISFVYFVA